MPNTAIKYDRIFIDEALNEIKFGGVEYIILTVIEIINDNL